MWRNPDRLRDIEQKLRCWGYLSRYPDAARDVAWLLDQLAERDARIAELEQRRQRNGWAFSLRSKSGGQSSPTGDAAWAQAA